LVGVNTYTPNDHYIVINDLPKTGDLKSLLPERYGAGPVLVDTNR
jgi:hypothetical protein